MLSTLVLRLIAGEIRGPSLTDGPGYDALA